MLCISIFLALGMLFTIVLSATTITSEKESRSWPLLLATTLSDWQILFGKFVGILRRCSLVWILLFGHVILFALAGFIHPLAIFQMAILVVWIIVFFAGTGLYFSSRFKRTTTAVVMNFALAVTIWGLIPLLMGIITGITRSSDDLVAGYCNIIPFVQGVVVMDATVGYSYPIGYFPWPSGNLNVVDSTFLMLAFMIAYMFVAFLFAWRAKCRFRRNIFWTFLKTQPLARVLLEKHLINLPGSITWERPAKMNPVDR